MAYLELKAITKRFPGVVANDRVDLTIEKGEIHALVGENGAGKSTLMRILFGLEQPDGGEIRLDDHDLKISSPAVAIKNGIGMVHQHFQIVPSMTVLENITLGAETGRAGLVDRRAALERVKEIAGRLGIDLPWQSRVSDLSLGPQQRVEILKALYRQARLLIFDEPTAVLTAQESDQLFAVLRKLAAEGVTIIIITHKLQEVMALSRRITVIRRGKVAGMLETARTSPAEVAHLMLGEEIKPSHREGRSDPGPTALEIRNLWALDRRGLAALRGLDLDLRRGEIVGVAGVEGNGQHELVHVLAGLSKIQAGSVRLLGGEINSANPRRRREAGLAVIPGDRNTEGLSRVSTIRDNLAANRFYQKPLSDGGLLHSGRLNEYARRLVGLFQVKTPSVRELVGSLSGGNAQKLVAAREIDGSPEVLLAAYPSRGVDVRSTGFIQSKLLELRGQGKAVLLISEDLTEILNLCDRLVVLFQGRFVGEFRPEDADIRQLGALMTGANPVQAAPIEPGNDDQLVNRASGEDAKLDRNRKN